MGFRPTTQYDTLIATIKVTLAAHSNDEHTLRQIAKHGGKTSQEIAKSKSAGDEEVTGGKEIKS